MSWWSPGQAQAAPSPHSLPPAPYPHSLPSPPSALCPAPLLPFCCAPQRSFSALCQRRWRRWAELVNFSRLFRCGVWRQSKRIQIAQVNILLRLRLDHLVLHSFPSPLLSPPLSPRLLNWGLTQHLPLFANRLEAAAVVQVCVRIGVRVGVRVWLRLQPLQL